MTLVATASQRIGSGASADPRHVDPHFFGSRYLDLDEPTPALVAVRAAAHPAFDRVVLDLDGELPGYDVRYVPWSVPTGAGGRETRAQLRITADPCVPLVDDEPPMLLIESGLAAVRGVVCASDRDEVLTYRIGLADRLPFLVRWAVAPSRVVVDVEHAAPGTGAQVLRPGDLGAAVATWQWRLRLALHRDNHSLPVDEVFGAVTEDATREFQRRTELPEDGIVGPLSRAAMERLLGV
jgi:peptidoglycan hydrolase-like protein with peptidoglycan-binding domain